MFDPYLLIEREGILVNHYAKLHEKEKITKPSALLLYHTCASCFGKQVLAPLTHHMKNLNSKHISFISYINLSYFP